MFNDLAIPKSTTNFDQNLDRMEVCSKISFTSVHADDGDFMLSGQSNSRQVSFGGSSEHIGGRMVEGAHVV